MMLRYTAYKTKRTIHQGGIWLTLSRVFSTARELTSNLVYEFTLLNNRIYFSLFSVGKTLKKTKPFPKAIGADGYRLVRFPSALTLVSHGKPGRRPRKPKESRRGG